MAWMFIDTHERQTFRYGWLDVGASSRLSPRAHVGRAQHVIRLIARDRHLLSHASGIVVVAGPGSFSSIRMGVLTANLLARLLHKPLVGISVEEAGDLPKLARRLSKKSFPTASYVAPVYDAEPNITSPRLLP